MSEALVELARSLLAAGKEPFDVCLEVSAARVRAGNAGPSAQEIMRRVSGFEDYDVMADWQERARRTLGR